ncbi:hypothetical protein H4P12_00175 [Paracoccus sp. 11-3]|uniref:Uncharacterized protein n=1 Tax=Paracoccus amoyensis TaxID=2760093 RepID=A0A926GB93_9RHOB|nr:hypothetical protein [Paracoccus amoyensis]MBC9245162.1 hypothetical protein [Paracoccus amoyensis]
MKRLDLEAGDLIAIAMCYIDIIEMATRCDQTEEGKAINRVAFDAVAKLAEAKDALKEHAEEVGKGLT